MGVRGLHLEALVTCMGWVMGVWVVVSPCGACGMGTGLTVAGRET